MENFKKNYLENEKKIQELQKENKKIIIDIIYKYFKQNQISCVLNNISINRIVFTAKVIDLKNIIFELDKNDNHDYKDKKINFYFQKDELIIAFDDKESAKKFVHDFNIILCKKENYENFIDLDHAIKNYNDLYDELKQKTFYYGDIIKTKEGYFILGDGDPNEGKMAFHKINCNENELNEYLVKEKQSLIILS